MADQEKEVSLGDVVNRAVAFEEDLKGEIMTINVGPSHPSTHGVLRLKVKLDGEVVTEVEPVIGYLHRGDEKIAENMTYNQFVPYTDRLDLRHDHPLRKDFPLAGQEADLPAADVALATGQKVIPAPMEGGPYHSPPGGRMSESEPRGNDESWSEKREKPSGQ